MSKEKDQRWIAGIRSRDNSILEEIYKDILPGIVKWVKQNNGNEDDARDLFQEMIISVYKKCKSEDFSLTCSFWSYALIVCRNLWFAKNRNRDKISYKAEFNGEEVIVEEGMQQHIERQEQYNLYKKHFSAIGDSCRELLSMFFAKVKMAEIAVKLGTTLAYVKKKKFKCKENLVNRIKEDRMFNELVK